MNEPRFDVVVSLDDDMIAWQPLHESLEDLDAAGFAPHRFHHVGEADLARVDLDLGGVLAPKLFGGSAWLIEKKDDARTPPRVLGCAGYGLEAGDVPVAGPFALDDALAPFRMTIVLAVLFSLRERGYDRAIIRNVRGSAVDRMSATFGASIRRIEEIVPPERPRVVICASGSGSNFQAVVDAVRAGRLEVDVVRLVVNRTSAYARERAAAAGIDCVTLPWDRTSTTRAAYDASVADAVAEARPDLVLLLGWMHLLPASFVAAFPELLNVHPAYLPLDPALDAVVLPDRTSQPAFRGAHAVDDALSAGARWIGASVHRVTEATDRGEIIARAPLALRDDESRGELDRRLHALEHRLLIDALHERLLAAGSREVAGGIG